MKKSDRQQRFTKTRPLGNKKILVEERILFKAHRLRPACGEGCARDEGKRVMMMLVLCPCTGLSTPGRIAKGSRTRSVTRAGASPSKRLAPGKQARSLRPRPPQAPGKRERGSRKSTNTARIIKAPTVSITADALLAGARA